MHMTTRLKTTNPVEMSPIVLPVISSLSASRQPPVGVQSQQPGPAFSVPSDMARPALMKAVVSSWFTSKVGSPFGARSLISFSASLLACARMNSSKMTARKRLTTNIPPMTAMPMK